MDYPFATVAQVILDRAIKILYTSERVTNTDMCQGTGPATLKRALAIAQIHVIAAPDLPVQVTRVVSYTIVVSVVFAVLL